MKKAWLLGLMVLLSPLVASAGSRAERLMQFESSMLVEGAIEITPLGGVSSVTIDREEKFPVGLVDFVKKQAMAWKFEPVVLDGEPTRARSLMSLRVVAKKLDEDRYTIGIRSASFDGDAPGEGETLTSVGMDAPSYPRAIAMDHVSGVAYVVAKVGADGTVVDAIVEQVNLMTAGTTSDMARWRKLLTSAALGAARKWTFNVPVKGEQAAQEFWLTRVPVAFLSDRKLDIAYGKWEMYIPGPRQSIPWSDEERPGFSPDTLAAGGVYMIGQSKGLKLLTALDES